MGVQGSGSVSACAGTWLSCVPLLWALAGLGRSPDTKSPGVGRAVGRPGVVCTEHASHGKNFRETLAVQAGSAVSLRLRGEPPFPHPVSATTENYVTSGNLQKRSRLQFSDLLNGHNMHVHPLRLFCRLKDTNTHHVVKTVSGAW